MSIQHHIYSEAGENRVNEDVVSVRRHPEDEGVLLCCLADGQGGRAGGARAAQVAVEESLRALSSFPVDKLFQTDSWYAVAAAADEAVCENDAAGFCTLVSLAISQQEVCGASCGDSAALFWSGGEDVLLTENQRKNPPIGSSAAYPVAFSARLDPGWKLLIVSDGVWKCVGWDQIIRSVARNQGLELIAALRQAALDANAGKMEDDFSVALLYEDQ